MSLVKLHVLPKGDSWACNALMFIQMTDGMDDETWNFHLKHHDYSKWFADSLHDNKLAQWAKEIESTGTVALSHVKAR